jgi:hypothetical protein
MKLLIVGGTATSDSVKRARTAGRLSAIINSASVSSVSGSRFDQSSHGSSSILFKAARSCAMLPLM